MDIQMAAPPNPRERFDAVEEQRKALGLSVSLLCRRADINEATYRQLAKSRTRLPHYRTIGRLERSIRSLCEAQGQPS
jgi:transcriptional regulator with XRE-family HTH domain